MLAHRPMLGKGLQQPMRARKLALPVRAAAGSFQTTVRPYTLRKGDTIETIAKKRGLKVVEVLGMNPDLDPAKVKDGQTILLPAAQLSKRDKEILDGIGAGYRLYPVRAGEALNDIISKRNITLDELKSLNVDIDVTKLKENQLIKLPANKFTVREREMLIGSGILPPEFFVAARNPFVIGVGALLGVCGFVLAWMKFHRDEDDVEDAAKSTKAWRV